MKRLLREYAKAVLVVAAVFGGAALALEVPAIEAGVRWGMRGLFNLVGEYRWAAVGVIVLALAGALTAANEMEAAQGETHDTDGGR